MVGLAENKANSVQLELELGLSLAISKFCFTNMSRPYATRASVTRTNFTKTVNLETNRNKLGLSCAKLSSKASKQLTSGKLPTN